MIVQMCITASTNVVLAPKALAYVSSFFGGILNSFEWNRKKLLVENLIYYVRIDLFYA